MQWCGGVSNFVTLFILSTVFFANYGVAQGQYEDNRCICVCPDPQIVNDNTTRSARKEYINPQVPSSQCTCDAVVLPKVRSILNGKEGEFCPRCDCKHESRNTTIIKVVVIIVIWIVSLLMIYMLFLMCLDPLLNKRVKNTAYTEHTNEDDESVGGGRTSHPLRMTNTEGGPPANVLNRVGHHQSKWKRQVQEQRKNIYDRHTMLN